MPKPAASMPPLLPRELEKLRLRMSKYSVRDRSGCLIWTGAERGSYGVITIKHRSYAAHRVALELSGQTLDPMQSVCHSCDNPKCIEVSHLSLGSHADNMRDMTAKGRSSGKVSPEDVREIRRRCAAGEHQRQVGADYGIKQPAVSNIIKGISWECVT